MQLKPKKFAYYLIPSETNFDLLMFDLDKYKDAIMATEHFDEVLYNRVNAHSDGTSFLVISSQPKTEHDWIKYHEHSAQHEEIRNGFLDEFIKTRRLISLDSGYGKFENGFFIRDLIVHG